MSKFEVGQLIECNSVHNVAYLTLGKKYKVIGDYYGKTIVLNDKGQNFAYERCLFKLVDNYPNPPHIHKDLIIAWANGAEIEAPDTNGGWSVVKSPAWRGIGQYRIKPTKSAKDVQIEELEAKAKEFLDKITELKESNNG